MDLKSILLKVQSKFRRSSNVPLTHKDTDYHKVLGVDDDETSRIVSTYISAQPNLKAQKTRRITIQSTIAGTFDCTLAKHSFTYPYPPVDPRNPAIRQESKIVVSYVEENGPAFIAGLKIGDEVLGVNGESVMNQPFSKVIERITKSVPTLLLDVVPNGDRESVAQSSLSNP